MTTDPTSATRNRGAVAAMPASGRAMQDRHLPALLFPRRIGRTVRTGSNARLSACKRDQDSGFSGPRRWL